MSETDSICGCVHVTANLLNPGWRSSGLICEQWCPLLAKCLSTCLNACWTCEGHLSRGKLRRELPNRCEKLCFICVCGTLQL